MYAGEYTKKVYGTLPQEYEAVVPLMLVYIPVFW